MGKQSLPLVSVVIPTVNRPFALSRAIRSVVKQTYPVIEIIVVDDGSQYDTEAYVKNQVDSLSYRVLRNSGKGPAVARNNGVRASSGPFIGFLDDDDEWLPQKIEKQVEAFAKSSDRVGIVCTDDIQVRDSTRRVRRRHLEGDVYRVLCREHRAGNTSNPLIKREVFIQVGGFDEELPAAQDTDLWLRVAQRYEFTTVKEPLVVVHRDGANRIGENYGKQLRGACVFLRKHWKVLHKSRKLRLIRTIIDLSGALARERFRCAG